MKTITLVATFVMKFWVIVENQPALLDVVAVGTLHAVHAAVNLCEVEAPELLVIVFGEVLKFRKTPSGCCPFWPLEEKLAGVPTGHDDSPNDCYCSP